MRLSGQSSKGLNHQSPESIRNIARKLSSDAVALPPITVEGMPISAIPHPEGVCKYRAEEQHEEILEELLNRLQYSQDPTFRARCDQCCPMCGIQCSHPDGFNHVGLHRSCHQPKGIRGVSLVRNSELSCESCVTSAKFNISFVLDRGKPEEKSIPYRKFNSHYKEWENPPYEGNSVPEPLQVRELIFATKQELLTEMFGEECKKCSTIPPEYYHDEKVLRDRLDFIRGML